ncbi:MAG: AbrB/MazE/SpoVT family DNA-binding domain-containing protein [Clostridia bacterium]|nr:AbrB/MazE/SpoVT family DNA-binding domain-containing protein [Clostridia bacterium]
MAEKERRCACAVTVGAKGQIVIPKEMRDLFDIRPGDRLLLLGDAAQGVLIPPKERFDELFSMVFGEGRENG